MNAPSRKIICYDIDGVLCKEICWSEEDCKKATPNQEQIDIVNELCDRAIVILYTARRYDLANATLKWLAKHGVRYWAINFNKLPADTYYDDRAINPIDTNS